MEKWSITEYEFKKLKNGRSMFIVHLVADTEEDIPEPQEDWLPGSIVQIADPHGYRVLNHEGEWKSCGSSGKSFAYGTITAVQGTFGKFYTPKFTPHGIAAETEVE